APTLPARAPDPDQRMRLWPCASRDHPQETPELGRSIALFLTADAESGGRDRRAIAGLVRLRPAAKRKSRRAGGVLSSNGRNFDCLKREKTEEGEGGIAGSSHFIAGCSP